MRTAGRVCVFPTMTPLSRPASPRAIAAVASAEGRWPLGAMFALILIVTLVAYFPALTGDFLWDDAGHVTTSELQSWSGLLRIWFELGVTQQYYPLLHSAFWLEHRFWGDSTLGYHLMNVLWHATISHACSSSFCGGSSCPVRCWPGCCSRCIRFVSNRSRGSPNRRTRSRLVFTWRRRSRGCGSRRIELTTLRGRDALVCRGAPHQNGHRHVAAGLARHRLVAPRPPIVARRRAPVGPVVRRSRRCGVVHCLVRAHRHRRARRRFQFERRRALLAGGKGFLVLRRQAGLAGGPSVLLSTLGRRCGGRLAISVPGRGSRAPGRTGLESSTGARAGLLTAALLFGGTLFPVLGFVNVYPFVFSYVADHFQYHAALSLFALVAAGFVDAIHSGPATRRARTRRRDYCVARRTHVATEQRISGFDYALSRDTGA